MFQHPNHKGARRRRRRAKTWKLTWKCNEVELPQSDKWNRLPGSPGSPESPKEAGPKEEHTKAHHNYISQDETEGENLRSSKRKDTVTYKGVPIRLSADFSRETLQARRGWKEVFKVMKAKDLHPRLLYPAKLSFRMEGQIKYFSDKVKFKEFILA